jgi:hypothetical protein
MHGIAAWPRQGLGVTATGTDTVMVAMYAGLAWNRGKMVALLGREGG